MKAARARVDRRVDCQCIDEEGRCGNVETTRLYRHGCGAVVSMCAYHHAATTDGHWTRVP